MSSRRRTLTDDKPDPAEVERAAQLIDIVDDLDNTLGQYEGEPTIHLYRVDEAGKEWYLCESSHSGGVAPAVVQAKYGGGEFRVKLWVKGHRGCIKVYRMPIDGRPKPRAEDEPLKSTAALPGGENVSMMLALMKMQQESFERLGGLISQGFNNMANQGRGNGLSLAEVVQWKQIFGGNGGDMTSLMQPLLGFVTSQLDKVGGKTIGAAKTTDNDVLMEMARTLLPAIVKNVTTAQAATPMIAAPTVFVPGTVTPTPSAVVANPARIDPPPKPKPVLNPFTVVQSAPEDSVSPSNDSLIAQGVNALIAMAERNGAPNAAAQLIADSVPEAEIIELLDADDWFDQLAALDPRLLQHRAWAYEVKAHLDELFPPDEDQAA